MQRPHGSVEEKLGVPGEPVLPRGQVLGVCIREKTLGLLAGEVLVGRQG
ncbi:hypothetical protein [Streptomyces sp. 7N604]